MEDAPRLLEVGIKVWDAEKRQGATQEHNLHTSRTDSGEHIRTSRRPDILQAGAWAKSIQREVQDLLVLEAETEVSHLLGHSFLCILELYRRARGVVQRRDSKQSGKVKSGRRSKQLHTADMIWLILGQTPVPWFGTTPPPSCPSSSLRVSSRRDRSGPCRSSSKRINSSHTTKFTTNCEASPTEYKIEPEHFHIRTEVLALC